MIRRALHHLAHTEDLLRLASDYRDICRAQVAIIHQKNLEIADLKLGYARWGAHLLQTLYDAAYADPALRDAISEGMRDMNDEIARLEEHHA